MKSIYPPRLPRKILTWVAGNAFIDDMLGDLDELFLIRLQSTSVAGAKLWYWRAALSIVFSYGLRKRKQAAFEKWPSSGFSIAMLKNYFIVSGRNLYQHKYFSILNVFGLAIGMSVSLLLIALINSISTYDNFHVNKDQLYTIISTRSEGVESIDFATAPVVLADRLQHYSDIEEVVRIKKVYNEVKKATGNISIKCYYTGSEFLRTFSFSVAQGNAALALATPNTILLTKSSALKIFNTESALGQVVELDNGSLYEVGAILDDHPMNSHLSFDALVSYASLPESRLSQLDQWTTYGSEYVYVLLRERSNATNLVNHLTSISTSVYTSSPIRVAFDVQHISDITMGPDLRNAIGPKWEYSGLLVFAVFALLILLPACFNYTNISIARALKRAKEIALRKTMGGINRQIFFQFITEAVIITLISLTGGVLIFILIRAEFQSMMVASSHLDLSLTPQILLSFVLLAIATGFLAGAFPALYFARLNPIQAFKNKGGSKSSVGMRVRKGLTVFQFMLSFGFILSLIVFYRQYQYSINFNFGFTKENMIDVELQDVNPELVRSEFAGIPGVQSISMSSGLLGLSYSSTWVKNGSDSTEVSQLFVDDRFIPNYGLQFIAGRNFPSDVWQRETGIVVNEEFVKAYRISTPHDAIGKIVDVDGQPLEVIGVLKNFHFAPLRFPIDKFFFRTNPNQFFYANLKVATPDSYALFHQLEKKWKTLDPERKLKAQFFEQELLDGYQSYFVLVKIVGFLGLLAITISLLGMLGMVVYTAESKTKEVGIRKVMGASVQSITYLLSKDYIKLMAVAIVIAAPLTAFLLDYLLTEIQYYSVTLRVWDVLWGVVLLVSLGIFTVASQTYKTATANPAETLKYE